MSDDGKEYSEFIQAQLAAENERRKSVNDRAATALTASVGLVTVVLAVFAVVKGRDTTISGSAKWYLIVALLALLTSAVCAVLASIPWRTKVVEPGVLFAMLDSHWSDGEEAARNTTAYCNAIALESLRLGTTIKFYFLIGAGVCQIVTVGALGACTWAITA